MPREAVSNTDNGEGSTPDRLVFEDDDPGLDQCRTYCTFYLAGACHFYLAPAKSQCDNTSYVKSPCYLAHFSSVSGVDRTRRIRDAVEAALSDIILLGTEEHVRLATKAVRQLVAGHPVHTHELVVSLRAFVRDALDRDPVPAGLTIAMQGPTRPVSPGGGRGGLGGGGPEGGGMGYDVPGDDPHHVAAQNEEP